MKRTVIHAVAGIGIAAIGAGALCGCESLSKKFTRPKKEDAQKKAELVLAPEEYQRDGLSNRDLYRQDFLFWQSWYDELMKNMAENGNRKKQLECISEQVKNLADLKSLLGPERQERLQGYIDLLGKLKISIEQDTTGFNLQANQRQAQKIGQAIRREFAFKQVKDSL